MILKAELLVTNVSSSTTIDTNYYQKVPNDGLKNNGYFISKKSNRYSFVTALVPFSILRYQYHLLKQGTKWYH